MIKGRIFFDKEKGKISLLWWKIVLFPGSAGSFILGQNIVCTLFLVVLNEILHPSTERIGVNTTESKMDIWTKSFSSLHFLTE